MWYALAFYVGEKRMRPLPSRGKIAQDGLLDKMGRCKNSYSVYKITFIEILTFGLI